MKIYIVTDLEGVTGVFKWSQTRERGIEFDRAMRQLMADIASVAEGLRIGGASEIWALDGHNGGNNFIPECMASGVRYITGMPRGASLWGLDESFAGVVLLGYHAMNGTMDGTLYHTQTSSNEAKFIYDGVERGEIFQSAVVAGHYNVPVILATGDEATCREARATLDEDLPVVAVKKGISREAAVLLAPEDARELLIEGGKRAMSEIGKRKPLIPKFPMQLKVRTLSARVYGQENPYFSDVDLQVNNGLDVISGSNR